MNNLIPHKVDKWYDKYTRNWIIQVLDIEGNEIECSYAGNKKSAEYDVKLFKEKYKL